METVELKEHPFQRYEQAVKGSGGYFFRRRAVKDLAAAVARAGYPEHFKQIWTKTHGAKRILTVKDRKAALEALERPEAARIRRERAALAHKRKELNV